MEGKVATVFDDLVYRSVPFYEEILRMISEIAKKHVVLKDTQVYDLGCFTGTTIIYINQEIDPSIETIGIDHFMDILKNTN